MTSKKEVKYKSRFQAWLEDEEFKVWLQRDKDETQVYCRLWMKAFPIATHGKTSLSLQASREKYKARILSATQRILVALAKLIAEGWQRLGGWRDCWE